MAWWVALFVQPSWRSSFRPPSTEWSDLASFALPDLSLVVPLCIVAAFLLWRGAPWGIALAWAAAGAVCYSAGYVIAWAWLRDGAWLGVAGMVPAAALSVFFALDASAPHIAVFRRARPRTVAGNLAVTFVYIVLFWTTFLFVIPACIAFVEGKLGVPTLAFPAQRAVAVALFVASSFAALWSGVTMARAGAGTPLPMDGTSRLVVSGPYAYVRNPMMVTGLLQAVAVAFWLGSWGTIAYAIGGGVLWHLFVRPAEERDLLARYGSSYEGYRDEVRCWVPRRSPWTRLSDPPA